MFKRLSNILSGLAPQPPQPRGKISAHYDRDFGPLGAKKSGGKTRKGLSHYKKTTIIDHHATRQNARNTVYDSIEARTLLKRSNDYALGKGPRLDPTPETSVLNITAEEARVWGEDIASRFNLWAQSKSSDITGRNNLYQNIRFSGLQSKRDGEVFIRLHYSKSKKLINPLQISFLDANQIRGDEFTFAAGPITQTDGIKKDANGKETGYVVWINDPAKIGRYKFIDIPAVDKRSGRLLMVHMYETEYAGQTRGISKFGHTIQDFDDITSYAGATLTRAINGASLNLTVENDQQDPSDMGLAELDSGAAGPIVETDTTETYTDPITFGVEGVTYSDLSEATLTEPGVNVFGGRQGDKVKAMPDMAPPETSGTFISERFNFLSASMGDSPEVMQMKFGSSFSASKAAFGMQENTAQIDRSDIESDISNPIYEMWVSEEIAAGRVKAPGFSDPILRAAWLKNRWIGPNPIDLNPVQTANANKINAELGLTDLDSASMTLNGSSGQANRAKLTRQLDELPTDPFGIRETEVDEEMDINEEDE